MTTEALVKLAASGNVRSVEEAWLAMLEQDASVEQWQERAEILETFARTERGAEAEAMATTALESLTKSLSGPEVLAVAAAFLLAVKDSDALRQAVGDLYREVHGDVEGLEALLAEAGVEGGRPPRRALRTLDVCLGIEEGSLLAHRHENDAARVIRIDRDSWHIAVETGRGTQQFGAVELADSYRPAEDDDFRVLAQFRPERLVEMLNEDPARVIADILRVNGPTMDSDALHALLSPRFIAAKDWNKWWTKARQALRLSAHVKIEGRAPFYLKYDASPASFDEETESRLARAHDATKELELIEEYVRGCRLRKQAVDVKILARARQRIEERARRAVTRTGKLELTSYLAARRIAVLAGDANPNAHLIEALQNAPDPAAAILVVENPAFWPAACEALEQAHPDNLAAALERLLPHAPLRVADHLAEKLVELGYTHQQFVRIAEEILREPVRLNEGLLWLWNGPAAEAARITMPLVTILTRVLHALGEVRRRDDVSREHIKQIQLNSRDVLKARNFARFKEMLEKIEPGVALALRTEIGRLDNLGRVSDDLLRLIRTKFPQLTVVAPRLPRWLQDDVLYVTEAGHRRKHAELEELVNVKMRQNAVAIGKAAELGDLSENSEYKFALEERDLLQARIGQAQREMEAAQILRPADIPIDRVGIGCRVVLEHVATGTRQEITILGPWEANQEQRIYNYRTPLAQSVLGTKVGDSATVEFFEPPGEYRVVEVTSALP